MSRIISLEGLSDKQRKEIEAVLHPIVVNISSLDDGLAHQIQDVLDSNIKLDPNEAVKTVREYLRSRKNAS